MSTAAQIAANRENAQHSTGPTSAEGKATSSLNAVKPASPDAPSCCPPRTPPPTKPTFRASLPATSPSATKNKIWCNP
jgi:hypothetical protein